MKSEKWDKAEEIDRGIELLLTDPDSKLLNKLQTPCSVFATFETEEGCQRALAYNTSGQMPFLGEMIDVQQASEPTDIIWENR